MQDGDPTPVMIVSTGLLWATKGAISINVAETTNICMRQISNITFTFLLILFTFAKILMADDLHNKDRTF